MVYTYFITLVNPMLMAIQIGVHLAKIKNEDTRKFSIFMSTRGRQLSWCVE